MYYQSEETLNAYMSADLEKKGYILTSKLKSGGFGHIYLCMKNNSKFCIKVQPKDIGECTIARELQTLKAIHDKKIDGHEYIL